MDIPRAMQNVSAQTGSIPVTDMTLAPMLANELPLINLDATLLINIGLWLVLFFLLRATLWDPMLRLIRAREHGMRGARDEATRLDKDAAKLRAQYEGALKNAQATAARARDEIREQAARKESELLTTAREKSNEVIEARRAEIRAQRETLRAEIKATVPQLASGIASRVLGREVKS